MPFQVDPVASGSSSGSSAPTRLKSLDGNFEAFVKVDGKELVVYKPEWESKLAKGWLISDYGKVGAVSIREFPIA